MKRIGTLMGRFPLYLDPSNPTGYRIGAPGERRRYPSEAHKPALDRFDALKLDTVRKPRPHWQEDKG